MKVYNTLSREVEEFKPYSDGQVKVYSCGPTVYDYPQIGNLRSFVFADTLRRVLEFNKYTVKFVMNITDVGHLVSDEDEGEDKLEKGAKREDKTVLQVADFYIQAFLNDAKQLNIAPPNGYNGPNGNYARATDFIQQQLDIVKLLVDKDFGYITDQAIYFDITKLSDYGKLSNQKLSEKEVAARSGVVSDSNKRNPQDFALWFFKTGRFANHSLSWPSPWGDGFPGWHLECSGIIHATLGEPIDIHTGGVDHIGTHHTNEIAQTEAAFGKPLSKYWMHNEFLLVDGQKMAKSAGNFITLQSIVEKGLDPLALRLLFLQAHYRSELNFTWESLQSAQRFLNRLRAWSDLKFQPKAHQTSLTMSYKTTIENISLALANDLNTSVAISEISKLVNISDNEGIAGPDIQTFLDDIDALLGLGIDQRPDIDQKLKDLIQKREIARLGQDWDGADLARTELLKAGLVIKDTKFGPIWQRI